MPAHAIILTKGSELYFSLKERKVKELNLALFQIFWLKRTKKATNFMTVTTTLEFFTESFSNQFNKTQERGNSYYDQREFPALMNRILKTRQRNVQQIKTGERHRTKTIVVRLSTTHIPSHQIRTKELPSLWSVCVVSPVGNMLPANTEREEDISSLFLFMQ